MTSLSVLVDSNLLLLLIVGLTSRDYVAKHKRLREFTPEDFDLLKEQLSVASEILVTPNTLTETSNLIDHIGEPARSKIFSKLRELVSLSSTRETYLPSHSALSRLELPRLGLTDCALLDACASGTPLITVDLHLYLAAVSAGNKALNFNHLRDARL
ncbi:hypothetical protein METUNv1_00217 [Methyloversatilis universalis FAM5]|uniref:PIN domain-containing protein n=1 Tax=Methyloversatilis universalis (strain ATCC BAA-1314 / DSM 25237 / JCM 13912 / CCUG 52030 / FAM5) TaxID=1000565 RepID=F5R7K9_METUF|nr:hypothetical protein METUNv1_00217 [Methyloversatilis universalis FAM5]